jgi:hypothetical protein
MENFKLKYADIKDSIKISREKKSVSNLSVTNCMTNCESCVTDCTECVTSLCIACVVNGSGSVCTLNSLETAPCNPLTDVGTQMYYDEIPKMEVHWND